MGQLLELKKRIVVCRLIEKINNNKKYAKEIGLGYTLLTNIEKEKGYEKIGRTHQSTKGRENKRYANMPNMWK